MQGGSKLEPERREGTCGRAHHLRLRRALRWPPLHFALVGGLLFAAEAALRSDEPRAADERPRIEVTDRHVRALVAQHERRIGQSADPATVRALVDRFVEEEILYREALRRGLATDNPAVARPPAPEARVPGRRACRRDGGRGGRPREAAALGLADDDVVLRNMFVRNMRLLLAREADRAPTEPELESHLQRHADDFRTPARVSWRHVLLGEYRSRRGAPHRGRRAPRSASKRRCCHRSGQRRSAIRSPEGTRSAA